MTNLAIDIGKAFNIHLDYSNRSIEKVEKILAQIHNEYVTNKNDEGLNGVALGFAFYIISVIENNFEKGKVEEM